MRLGDVLALAALATAHARIIDFEKEGTQHWEDALAQACGTS